jgi:SHS2 domain-containing protein
MSLPFEQLSHNADIKIRAYGKTKEELFENALRGMFESIRPRINEKKPQTTRLLATEAATLEELFINFLSDCLYLSSVNHEIYRDVQFLEFSDEHLHASLIGIPIEGLDASEIKAVTHYDFELKREKENLVATFVLDI